MKLPPYASFGGKRETGEVADLSSDNELPELLEEREMLRDRNAADRRRLKTIDRQLKAKLGDAPRASLPGWSICWVERSRCSYEVEELSYRFLWVERS